MRMFPSRRSELQAQRYRPRGWFVKSFCSSRSLCELKHSACLRRRRPAGSEAPQCPYKHRRRACRRRCAWPVRRLATAAGCRIIRLGLPSLVPIDHAVPLRTEKLGPPDPYCAVISTWSIEMLLLSTFEDCVTLPGVGWANCGLRDLDGGVGRRYRIGQGLGACRSCGSAARHLIPAAATSSKGQQGECDGSAQCRGSCQSSTQ